MTPDDQYVLGIDIGGTKIEAQLFKVTHGALASDSSWEIKQDTKKGVADHTQQIAEIIKTASMQTGDGTLVGIGIGSPGRFDEKGIIKPGTNTNLGIKPSDFDGINLREAYLTAMEPALKFIPLYVGNDGNAMLAGILEAINTGKSSGLADQYGREISGFTLRRKHVALFGIGTGVGHAIAKVDDEGAFTFHTDGHASKLRVKVDDGADWQFITKAIARAGASEVVAFEDHSVRAEDLFRGPMIKAMAGITDNGTMDFTNPDHIAALKFAGKYMARTIALKKSRKSVDVNPTHGWNDADKAEAAKTSIYLIGGGMGSSPIGKAIIAYAKTELENLGMSDIQLVQVTGKNSAAHAAASMVPEIVYRGVSNRRR